MQLRGQQHSYTNLISTTVQHEMTSPSSTRSYPFTGVYELSSKLPSFNMPSSEPHRIMTSIARARSGSASWGFMNSMMRHRDRDNFEGHPAEKKFTQEEQDEEDEQARRQAMKNLVNSWQERLQLISVITTFFASTEAAMLVNTKPANQNDFEDGTLKVANAALLGALILHVYASVLSFLGAFLLISYKLKEARREEMRAEGIPVTNSPAGDVERGERGPIDPELQTSNDAQSMGRTQTAPERSNADGAYPEKRDVFSADPHIEQVVPFLPHASSHRLLSRTHALCVFLAALGFVLAIIGILCYAWALQPTSVSIFASICSGIALFTLVFLRT